MKIIIYDCEIINAIPNRDGSIIDGITYCAGWRDFGNMGVSVTGVYDYVEDRYRIFCEDNMSNFESLISERDLCVGFNSIPFDNELLYASGWPVPNEANCYDLLRETWTAAGLGPDFNFKTHGGYGLDAICAHNFSMSKSGNGAIAPVDWQQGRRGMVIDYCLNDVRLTKRLLDNVLLDMPIISPRTGTSLTLRNPRKAAK